MKKLLIVLPAYNEAQIIKKVILELKKFLKDLKYQSTIVVINDGSTDKTAKIAKKAGAFVLNHQINRGYGAATQTGIEYGRLTNADYLISFDSDGQHYPHDITKVLTSLEKGHDLVIGSRFLSKNNIPFLRRLVLNLANLSTFIFFGMWVSDSQSGFRGFNKKALQKINLVTNSMEVSSELYGEIKKNKLKFTEVPISVKYTEYSLSKGQTNLNSLNNLIKLLYKLFR